MDFNSALSNNVFNISTISTPIDDEHSLSSSQRGFWNILTFTIIIIGTVANITMLVLLVKEKKKTSYTVYAGATVINDIVYLIITFLEISVFALFDITINTTNAVVCKCMPYILSSSIYLHGWFVLALTTEKLIHAYFPRMTKLFDRRTTGLIVVFFIVCASLFLNLHYILHVDLRDMLLNDGTVISVCDAVDLYGEDEYRLYVILHLRFVMPLIAVVLPGVCIIIGNIFLMKAFCQSLRAPATTRKISVHARDMYVFTIMMSVMFLCIDTPYAVIRYQTIWLAGTSFDDGIDILMYLNHSLKCLVYIIYRRAVRMHCIECKGTHQTDNIK